MKRHKFFIFDPTCAGLNPSLQQEAPHRIPSPFNPPSRVPSQGLSSSALSKNHLSRSVSQLERTDHSFPYSLFYFSRLRFQKNILFALPLNNNYLTQRIKELILQPAKGVRNTLQLFDAGCRD